MFRPQRRFWPMSLPLFMGSRRGVENIVRA